MKANFVEKFTTGKYKIGSFDIFVDEILDTISSNNKISTKQSKKLINNFPVTFRAAIVDQNNKYIGYIALYDIDSKNNTSSIRVELNENISSSDKVSIIDTFKSWVTSSLNIKEIKEEFIITPVCKDVKRYNVCPKTNVILNSDFLIPYVDNVTYNYFSYYYKIPNLVLPFTIKCCDKVLGIIGLCNVNFSNRRANLCIYFDFNIHDDIRNYLTSSIIDDYIDYVHNSNIHNICVTIPGHDKSKLDIVNDSKMNYFGYIPYGSINYDGFVESKYMFQHIPNMIKERGVVLPINIKKKEILFDSEKKEIDPLVEIGNGYKLVSPKVFDDMGINIDNIIDDYTDSLRNRDNFSIPLGEDKYIIQKGNGLYGTSCAVKNFCYILFDKDNNYSGFINIIRNNANGKNAEVEIGIKPGLQGHGLGKKVLETFYEQLFSIGYASVTSAVFSFNKASLKLHEKVANLNGIRIESYYINNNLWDMNFYSKVNELKK